MKDVVSNVKTTKLGVVLDILIDALLNNLNFCLNLVYI